MRYIDTRNNKINDCGFYFGLEEYLIKDYDYQEDIFLLWHVKPTVMIGRHQVTTIELDDQFVKDNNIDVVRRNSGGGAVYTDPGCLQFSFITKKENHQNIFLHHVSKIIETVNKLGLKAEFTGRNDILHEGRKFSGNAEFIHKDRMVVHGTILFNSDLNNLVGSLTPDKAKLTKHAVTSVKARVLNIGTLLDMNIDEFYNHVIDHIRTETVDLSELDSDLIMKYSQKFYDDSWNYGKNPTFDLVHKDKFDAGNITVSVIVSKNKIKQLRVTGDYFSLQDITTFEEAFIGTDFTYEGLKKVLKEFPVRDYVYKWKTKEFIGLFFERPKHNKKPSFLKINMKDLNRQTKKIRALLEQNNLHTVCQEASCPNQLECFSNKTATFMILGNHCTRNCAFCDVTHGIPLDVDNDEPNNILKAVQVMKLKHVVVTSVTRDDLDDHGSGQFVKVIEVLKEHAPDTTIEVLIPDFMGDKKAIERVVKAGPDVLNHNVETIPRLYEGFRDNADYQRSLEVLRYAKEIDPSILTKTGIMVGIGEEKNEVFDLMDDLREINCDIMTIGQYLQPSKNHAEVKEYIDLETYDEYKRVGKEKGFRFVASGPMVRSSYEALKQFEGE